MERTPYWLIKGGVVIDILAIPVMAIFFYGIYQHWKRIQMGDVRFRITWDLIKPFFTRQRLISFLGDGLLGRRVYRKPVTGLFHGMVFWGMFLLLMGTTLVLLNVVLGLSVMSGGIYKWFMALVLDTAGVAVLIGLAFLAVRRLTHYQRLHTPKARTGFLFMEAFLAVVVLSGFWLEALRINLAGAHETAYVGQMVAMLAGPMKAGAQETYTNWWWLHGLLALGFVAYIPFSPLAHLLFIPVNAALVEPVIGADEKKLDMENLEPDEEGNMPALGTPRLADYSPKRLFDFSTCLWCGRCQEVCPATQTNKKLTPKGVVITLAELLQQGRMTDSGLIDTMGMETLFECRTCGACVEACPSLVNPLKAIWGMRQNLMMERGEMPVNMLQAYRNMEALMHPFSSSASPSDWRKGLDVPVYTPGETEYLLWIGCAVTYEDRAQQVGRAMVTILNSAGLSYGIIEEARCTGDPAKQMGDDYLFSMMADANIQLFENYGVKKIITLCPHCFNSFRKYYPPLGGVYEVIPHAKLLEDLITSGKLRLDYSNQKITYHDPCYMGRHNRVFDAPREVIGAVGKLTELDRNRTNSFCCGAGGGNYWNEEEGERISYTRAKEAFDSGAEKLASSCPFCLLMLTDGMKMYTQKKMVFDIAELVEQNLKQ
jgi:Fe-S oxidoreductase/nitrate reductase gamma subunit